MLKKIGIGIAVLLILPIVISALLPENENYHLSIVNSGAAEAKVTVAPSNESWTVPAGGALKVEVGKESDRKNSPAQTFTIEAGGKSSTVNGSVDKWGEFVLDITGSSCLMAVDYGPQYRAPDMELPEGQPDLVTVQILQEQKQFFELPDMPYQDKEDVFIATELGESLPEKIEGSYSSSLPVHVRLINVPCQLLSDGAALYRYLNDN